jgi:hypothetical protein
MRPTRVEDLDKGWPDRVRELITLVGCERRNDGPTTLPYP